MIVWSWSVRWGAHDTPPAYVKKKHDRWQHANARSRPQNTCKKQNPGPHRPLPVNFPPGEALPREIQKGTASRCGRRNTAYGTSPNVWDVFQEASRKDTQVCRKPFFDQCKTKIRPKHHRPKESTPAYGSANACPSKWPRSSVKNIFYMPEN